MSGGTPKHETSAASDSDYETEEETLLHVEVGGILQEDLRLATAAHLKFIDIESAEPLVQLGSQVLAGSYQDTLGTSLFFLKESGAPPSGGHDPVFGREVKTNVSFVAASRKKLLLKRVFVKERPTGGVASGTDLSATEAGSAASAATGRRPL